MGAKKIKAVKKPLKKAVPVLEETHLARVKAWVDKHYAYVMGGLALIVFVFLATWGIKAYENSKENRAQVEYTELASRFPSEGYGTQAAWEKIIPDLEKFVSDRKGTTAGLNAQISLAKAYFDVKRYDDSIKVASEALSKAPAGHGLIPLIHYQLAYACEAAGKMDQAAKEWESVKTSGLPGLEREADWNLGRIYAAQKDYAKAIELFEKASQAQGTYPAPVSVDQALANARSQGTTAPTK